MTTLSPYADRERRALKIMDERADEGHEWLAPFARRKAIEMQVQALRRVEADREYVEPARREREPRHVPAPAPTRRVVRKPRPIRFDRSLKILRRVVER